MRIQSKIKQNRTAAALLGVLMSLALLLALPGAATAADYYIATTGSNTSGDGSVGNPWQTLHYAVNNVFGPSDTIHVAAGIYGVSLEGDTVLELLEMQGITIAGDPAGGSVLDVSGAATWTSGIT
ncbi:MAG: hypothetical protein ACOZBW_11590, partial [Thermodesulfobacteriota bacterium]